MDRERISKVLYITFISLLGNFLAIMFFYSGAQSAQATPGTLSFGGPILWEVPIPIPNLVTLGAPCPAHTVILDYSKGVPTVEGFTIPNGFNVSAGVTFDYENIYTPGVQTLGEVLPLPLPTCAGLTPYPVYTVLFNPTSFRYQVGTGLVPGF